MLYSIIIPIYNEEKTLVTFLNELEPFSYQNEIIIINDGSDDKSKYILEGCPFVKTLHFDTNKGKGIAISEGIKESKYEKIIITDGDLELKTSELHKLMILDKMSKPFIIGSRYKSSSRITSLWDLGNFCLTFIFNIKNRTNITDALCCAKSFYKQDLNLNSLKSNRFDIDVEISTYLIKKYTITNTVYLSYKRRGPSEGKKLKITDGLIILNRILRS